MFNKVVLVGNLTRNIEMRYGQSGTAIGSSAIAVTRRYNSNGERREETCFIDLTFYGRTAEVANQYLSKGSKILIEGRLRFDQWSDQNGQNRSKHSVQVENMEMLGSNTGGGAHPAGAHPARENQSYDPYTSEASHSRTKSNPKNQEKIKEIDVDAYDNDNSDLPF